MMTRPSVLTATGLAASLAIIIPLLVIGNGTPEVQAAVIVQKLNDQLNQNPLFEVTLDAVSIEPVTVSGRMLIHGRNVSGDVDVSVRLHRSDPQAVLNIQGSLALTESGGWLLLKRVTTPIPGGQEAIDRLLPPDSHTLVLLSEDPTQTRMPATVGTVTLEILRSGKLGEVIRGLIELNGEHEGRLEPQPDESVLLTLPIDSQRIVTAIEDLVRAFMPETSSTIITGTGMIMIDQQFISFEQFGDDKLREELSAQVALQTNGRVTLTESGVEIDGVGLDQILQQANIEVQINQGGPGGSHELIGSTLTVSYDTEVEQARWIRFEDLGPGKGAITVNVLDTALDPSLLDSTAVTTPTTRTIKLEELPDMLGGLQRTLTRVP